LAVQGEYPETSKAVNTALGPGVLAPSGVGETFAKDVEMSRRRFPVQAMTSPTTRFAPGTFAVLFELLLARRAAISRCAESLRHEAVDALRDRDLSDLFDVEDPTADSDAAAALMLVQRAEGRLWEVEQALARVRDGTYGYCTGCGVGIPLERLRALPATAFCVACSDRASRPTIGRVVGDNSWTQSSPVGGVSVPGGG
jgi:DnaK suppressor protein